MNTSQRSRGFFPNSIPTANAIAVPAHDEPVSGWWAGNSEGSQSELLRQGSLIRGIELSILALTFTVLVFLSFKLTSTIRETAAEKPDVALETSLLDESTSCGRQLNLHLRIFSSDHNGSYPEYVEDLVRNGQIDPDEFYRLNWHKWSSGRMEPWLCLNFLSESASGDLPLLISPAMANGSRMVCFNDGQMKNLNALQFRECVPKLRESLKDSQEPWPQGLEGF